MTLTTFLRNLKSKLYESIAREQIREDEGELLKAYQDTVGVWTIGVGHTGPEVVRGLVISKEKSDDWFEEDLQEAIRDAKAFYPKFNELSHVRRAILVNMAFNLGRNKLMDFVGTKAAIEAGNYILAAIHMMNSKWAKQVKSRATRLAKQMVSNKVEKK